MAPSFCVYDEMSIDQFLMQISHGNFSNNPYNNTCKDHKTATAAPCSATPNP